MKKITRYIFFVMLVALPVLAQESPYFVTYDHHLEEPGNLEIETQSNAGFPRHGEPSYFAPYIELEYGFTTRWTSELYRRKEPEPQRRSGIRLFLRRFAAPGHHRFRCQLSSLPREFHRWCRAVWRLGKHKGFRLPRHYPLFRSGALLAGEQQQLAAFF